jgi:ketosteroid isomerase-like protein
MSKSAFSGFALAVLVTFIPAVAMADTADDIERMEQQRGRAILNADMPTLYAIYADDFFYNLAAGNSLSRSEYLSMYASGDIKVHKAVNEDRDIRLYGDAAVVSGVVRVNATIRGENRNLNLRYLNVWIKRGGNWVLVARQATNLPQ